MFNEKVYKNEVGIMIKSPDESYKKFYEGKPCNIYLKNGSTEARVVIIENKSGRLKLSSAITAEECQNLTNEKTVELELTDLRRDPQTGVRNEKSKKEPNTMERAQVEKKTSRHVVDLGLDPDIGVDGKPILDQKTQKPMAKGNKENYQLCYLDIILKNSWKTRKCVKGIVVKVGKINKKLLIFMMPKLIESLLLGKIMVNLLVSGKWINPIK